MEDRSLNGLISRIPINIYIDPKITLDGIVSVIDNNGQIEEDYGYALYINSNLSKVFDKNFDIKQSFDDENVEELFPFIKHQILSNWENIEKAFKEDLEIENIEKPKFCQ